MSREELEALRRQVDEDYKLDVAAIDRLERRYLGGAHAAAPGSSSGNGALNDAPVSGVPARSCSTPSKWSEEAESRSEALIPPSPSLALPEWQRDELVGSLRTMFNVARK